MGGGKLLIPTSSTVRVVGLKEETMVGSYQETTERATGKERAQKFCPERKIDRQ